LAVDEPQLGTVVAGRGIHSAGLAHLGNLNAAEGAQHRHQHAALRLQGGHLLGDIQPLGGDVVQVTLGSGAVLDHRR
jgi:hypothetical protein